MTSFSTDFVPEEDGFQFVNRFDFSENLEQTMAGFLRLFGVESIDLGDLIYGLCGGMCYAALDYFHTGQDIPGTKKRPSPKYNAKLYSYLVQRQLDSLSLVTVYKLFRWLTRDEERMERLTLENEFPKLTQRISLRQPTVLVLIRSGDLSDLTKNHQVLAVGYDHNTVTKHVDIHLYDPNHPREKPVLTMDYGFSNGIVLQQTTGEPLWGFFVNAYEGEMPPSLGAYDARRGVINPNIY